MTSTLKLFLTQGHVIWALVLREMQTRYGRENLGYLWVVGEPILFCGGVTIVWSLIRPSQEHGLPITAFVVTGYIPLTMWRHCVARGLRAFEANGALLFHRQVAPIDIILARVILEIVGTLIAGVIIFFSAISLGFMEPPKDIGLLYTGILYHIAFCTASSLFIASLSERSEVIEKVISVATYLSLPLSGAFVMVSWVPEKYQWILLLSPSAQDLEMIRGGEFGFRSHPIYSYSYTTWVIGLMLVVSISLSLRSRRFIVVQ